MLSPILLFSALKIDIKYNGRLNNYTEVDVPGIVLTPRFDVSIT